MTSYRTIVLGAVVMASACAPLIAVADSVPAVPKAIVSTGTMDSVPAVPKAAMLEIVLMAASATHV